MGILLETSPQRMNLLKGGDIDNSTIANNPQDINDQIACKFLRRQIIGRNTLYEGNIRKTSVSPGELIEPGYNTEASDRNIAQESQNVNDENDHTTTRKAPVSPGELIEPGYNGEVSLKSAYKKPLANSLADVERNVVSDESAQITPNEDARLAPNNRSIEVADRQLADNFTGSTTDDSVANNSRNVNEGNVLAYDISGIRKSTGRGLEGSAISADALDQSIDNSSIAKDPQDVNSDKFQHPLQETINEMEANPKPRMTRELREAIDEFIYENIDHNLFNNNAIV